MNELAYDRAGSGPPPVLLHPLGADRQVWRPVIELLRAGIRQLELPGCGHIPMWDDPPAVAAALLAGSEHSLPRHLSRSG
jgi:pimeloyl-ACP methyl ester carboxylesterase